MIYLDYAAATPLDPAVLTAMLPYWQDKFHNPSSLYDEARAVRQDLNLARARCAKTLNVKPHELYFTAGATEANNLAIAGITRQFSGAGTVISNTEHEAVRQPAQAYSDTVEVAVDEDGRIKTADIAAAIKPETVLVSISYVNSEIGTIQPLREIAKTIRQLRVAREKAGSDRPLYFHSDISQAPGNLKTDLASLGLDMATVNGAKIYGPKQSGLLYVNRSITIKPLLYGGGQEKGLRGGTENVAFAVGLTKALEIAEATRSKSVIRYAALQERLLKCLKPLDDIKVNGGLKHRSAANLNLSFTGVDGETLVHYLDAAGIQVATGAACSANYDTPSHVLKAIGCSPAEIAGSLRLSFGRDTSLSDIDYVGAKLVELTQKLRQDR